MSPALLNNPGAAAVTGSGNFQMGNGAVFNNQGGVPFDQQSDGTLGGGIGGASTFNNAGTYNKSAGAGASVVNAAFNNSGTLDIASGALNFTASLTQTAGITSLSGGNLGGGITFNFTGGALVANNGSTITGNLNNAGANVRPGGSPGTLNIAGNYVQGAGGTLEIELGGFTPGTQFDVVAVTGTATLDGTLSVLSFGGFAPGANSSFQVMTYASATGDFANKTGLNIATPPLAGIPQAMFYLLTNAQDADLAVSKSDLPDPVTEGQNVTYTITVTNGGPGPASNATLNDPLPAGTTFVNLANLPAGWTCVVSFVPAPGVLNCTNPLVANGANDVFTLVVATTAAAVPSISNTATVSAVENDPTPANNSDTETTTVNPLTADLAVTKTDAPDPVNAGQNVTYTITVTNAGPDPATSVSLMDAVPANTTFVSLTAPAGWTCTTPPVGGTGMVTCTRASLASGANEVFTLVVATSAASAPSISNTATVSAAENDPNSGNNSDTENTAVNLVADISVTKADGADPVNVGQNIVYTVTVANAGPDAATAVMLTDTLPAAVTFVSAMASQGACGAPVGVALTCNLGTIASGANATVQITVTAGALAAPSVTNTASATTTSVDPNNANDSDAETTTVNPVADLAITKTDSPDPVSVGSNITYTIQVTNNGPSPATGVTVSDPIPAGLTFVSATGPAGVTCMQAGGTITCTLAGC